MTKEDISVVNIHLFEYICSDQAHSSRVISPQQISLPSLAEYPLNSFESIMIKYERLIRKPGTFNSPVPMQLGDNNPLPLLANLLNPELADCIPIEAWCVTSPDPPAVHVKDNTRLFQQDK